MTPSFIGRIATMFPGVRPSISLAALPTASTLLVILLMATIEGSRTTMPRPSAKTSVLAVPRSMARSLEKSEKNERKAKYLPFPRGSVLDQDAFLLQRLEAGAVDRADRDDFEAVAADGDDLAEDSRRVDVGGLARHGDRHARLGLSGDDDRAPDDLRAVDDEVGRD